MKTNMEKMAPRFAILRIQKLKQLTSVRRSLLHSFREQDTPNADPQRREENSHNGARSTDEAMEAIRKRLPEKYRRDAVITIEYLITASPEAMKAFTREEQDAYFSHSLRWLEKRHGKENVVYSGIHRDETTPHMYVYVVPIDPESGRLNAKRWLGGQQALSTMQTEFFEQVGLRHGLERGIPGSKAKHQSVKRFYATLENTGIDTPTKTLFGNIKPEDYNDIKTALNAYKTREKAIKQRELQLQWLTERLESAEEKASKAAEREKDLLDTIQLLEEKNQRQQERMEQLRSDYKAIDEYRMKLIDKVRLYESLYQTDGPSMEP